MRILLWKSVLVCLLFTAVLNIHICSVSAIGEGIYGSLRGFMGELGNVMSEVVAGIEKVSKGIKNVEEFLDATVDEDCFFECPPGRVPKPNQTHIPSSNGCGSMGLQDFISVDHLPMAEFVDCCNTHDVCYETCGNDKDECDLRFKKCLYKHCSTLKHSTTKLIHKACQAGAKILYSGTTMLGCKPYIDAQQTACLCVPIRDEF